MDCKKEVKGLKNSERTKCEVYSRVVGYLRPVQHWNEGKSAEFHRRKTFKLQTAMVPNLKVKEC